MPEVMQAPSTASATRGRSALLERVAALLDRDQVRWCWVHGSHAGAENVSDVDLVVEASAVPERLAGLLIGSRDELKADVTLWLDDGAQYIVLVCRGGSARPCVLPLHVSSDYELDGRMFYSGEQVLASRQQHGAIWAPAPAIEFGCVLTNRISKERFRAEHLQRLSELYTLDPAGCEKEAGQFFGPSNATALIQAARTGEWEPIRHALPALHDDLLASPAARRLRREPGRSLRRLRRWTSPPCGLHIVFLGPDGVGKSTVIDAVRRDLAPIFLRDKYLTFAPGLLPSRFEVPKPDGPHSLPPRSFAASLVKAAWWAVCYTAGYFLTIHSFLARSGLVINHRYLPDAIVDPKRYRYSGPKWILRALWRIAPKPHLLFLLDAPVEVIQARKMEVPPEETRRQREAYRKVLGRLPFTRIVDANRPLDQVVAEVEKIAIDYLSERATRQRLGEGRL